MAKLNVLLSIKNYHNKISSKIKSKNYIKKMKYTRIFKWS